jgi:membrane-associated protease RseP (regulator of RpoE activity)
MDVAATTTPSERQQIRSAWARAVIVFAGLSIAVVAVLVAIWPMPYDWATENVVLPRYEATFGFRGGRVRTSSDSDSTIYAIVEVVPGGPLALAGVKPGDIPVEYHGGVMAFLGALQQASGGHEGHFEVTSNLESWFRTHEGRRIVLATTKRVQ